MPNSSVQHGPDLRSLTLPAWNIKAVTVQLLLLIAAAYVLPAASHAVGLPVRGFLPMHWPVILVGLCYGWRSGLIIGASAPLVSFMLSGMPPLPMLPPMTLELAAYGSIAGIAREGLRLGWFLSTLTALIAGRFIFLGFAFSTGAITQPFLTYLQAAMLPGIPAAVGQLIALPIIARWWVGKT